MAGQKKNKRLKTIENGGIIHNIFSHLHALIQGKLQKIYHTCHCKKNNYNVGAFKLIFFLSTMTRIRLEYN